MKLLYLMTLLLFISSCKTSFRISALQPATVKIPVEVRTLGVINTVNTKNSPEKQVADILLSGQQINGNVIAAERAVDGLIIGLNKSRDLRGEVVAIDNMIDAEGSLNWGLLNTYAEERNLDGFIILNKVHSVSPIGGTVIGNVTGQSSSRLEGFLHFEVRLRSPDQRIEGLSCQSVYNIPLSGSTSILDIMNDVARKREAYRSMGYQLGDRAGAMLYPNWVWVDREYFNKGSKALKAAKPMIRAGNWDIAEKQLLQDEDNGKVKIRGRVLYNLALVKEGQGELDQAIIYAERAALECYNKEANQYLVKLRRRKNQLEKL